MTNDTHHHVRHVSSVPFPTLTSNVFWRPMTPPKTGDSTLLFSSCLYPGSAGNLRIFRREQSSPWTHDTAENKTKFSSIRGSITHDRIKNINSFHDGHDELQNDWPRVGVEYVARTQSWSICLLMRDALLRNVYVLVNTEKNNNL